MIAVNLKNVWIRAIGLFLSDIKNFRKVSSLNLIFLTAVVRSEGLHILLADDDEDDCEMFEDALRSVNENIKVTIISNGIKLMELLQKLENNLPDLIFLDLNMPLKNGMECLHEIKNSKTYADVPLVIYSTSCYTDHVNATYEKGADLYIQKPNSFSGIQKILKKIFELDLHGLVANRSKTNFLMT